MQISLNWLSAWIDLSGLSTQQIVETLSVSGLEVAAVTEIGQNIDSINKIVVGKIKSIVPHPKADRLVVCSVHIGEPEPRTIVCGAKNMVEGDIVPVALPGSQPPGIDFEIVERKVMGVVSSGMLCAQEELALAESSDGLWILPKELEAKIGTPIFDALNIRDTILEIEVTPNRPDALSHRGVARDLAALFQRKLSTIEERIAKIPDAFSSELTDIKQEITIRSEFEHLKVEIKTDTPVYYLAAEIEKVNVVPSPEWIQILLSKIGVRPINNIVDLTNFVMFDIGQPLHAFDQETVGSTLVVTNLKEGTPFTAINHKSYKLSDQDLVIASQDHTPLAIAGVMGGEDSEVSEKTKHILLECAFFDATSIRKASKRHAIHSDASHRYERGMDHTAIPEHFDYVVKLFAKALHIHTIGTPISAHNLPHLDLLTIDFPLATYERYIGEPINKGRAIHILESLGLTVTSNDTDLLHLVIPGFRPDLERPVDIVEELVRIVGMNSIPSQTNFSLTGNPPKEREDVNEVSKTLVPREVTQWIQQIRTSLLQSGFYENIAYSFITKETLNKLGLHSEDRRISAAVELLNQPGTVMRTSMLPSMLMAAANNASRRNFDLPLFEIGRTYFGDTKEEPLMLSLFTMGNRSTHFSTGNQTWDFYELKGLIEDLFAAHGLSLIFKRPQYSQSYLHPGVQADVFISKKSFTPCNKNEILPQSKVGTLGRLHPKFVRDNELPEPIFFAELELEKLIPDFSIIPQAASSSKYQAVSRDFAFLVPKSLAWSSIHSSILKAAKANPKLALDLRSCNVFDVFEGEQVEKGFRSIAIAVVYQSNEGTLTENEISSYDSIILDAVKNDHGLTLRS